MEHEDYWQADFTLTEIGGWWTFCTCGLAFRGESGEEAYARWEEHETETA